MSAKQWLADNCPNIESRDYQIEAWNSLWSTRASGQGRALIQLATGLGKTLVCAIDVMHYIAEENPSARVLFVSHVVDISQQAKHTFQFVDKTLTDRCTFTTFQWLSFNSTAYAPDLFDYIIYDEAHHSEADTFKEVRNYFQPKFALALTATPERGDGRDIMDYFGNPVYTKTLAEGIAEGWLSPVDYHLVLDDTLKKAVSTNFKVESLGELRALFKLKVRDKQIAHEIKARQEAIGLANAQTVVFCNTIKNAQHIAGILGGKPYYADLHPIERAQTLKEFRGGDLQTICTVSMFNEGIDIPNARLIVFLRSTSSRTIFEQQLGRGLRRAPGKTHVTVLDFAANIERINFTRDLGHTISRLRGIEKGYSGLNTGSSSSSSSSKLFDFGTSFEFDDIAFKLLDRFQTLKDRVYLTQKQVVAAYRENNDISGLAEEFGVTWNAIHKHLSAAGVYVSAHVGRSVTADEVVAKYKECGSVAATAKHFNVWVGTVKSRLLKAGVEITPTNRTIYASPELIAAFERLGSVRQAALELGINRSAAQNRLRNSGINISRGPKVPKVPKDTLDEVYRQNNGDITAIVDTLGVGWVGAYKALDEYGYIKPTKPLSSAVAAAAYWKYGTSTAASAELGVSSTMISRLSKQARFIRKYKSKKKLLKPR